MNTHWQRFKMPRQVSRRQRNVKREHPLYVTLYSGLVLVLLLNSSDTCRWPIRKSKSNWTCLIKIVSYKLTELSNFQQTVKTAVKSFLSYNLITVLHWQEHISIHVIHSLQTSYYLLVGLISHFCGFTSDSRLLDEIGLDAKDIIYYANLIENCLLPHLVIRKKEWNHFYGFLFHSFL